MTAYIQRAGTLESRTHFDTVVHEVDLCVIGGGMAGLCAAVAAARHGAKVLLMNDRPMLGGNASSEIRMWICGAHGADNKETGILEEIMLDNYARNEGLNYAVWDTLLYEKARFQLNLELLLNCTCNDVSMGGAVEYNGAVQNNANRIASVKAWQMTTQTWHIVRATFFADCSGDSILRVSGAEYRWGRESRQEFSESLAPAEADRKTMGNSLLLQLREVDRHIPFVPPSWACRYTPSELTNRPLMPRGNNFWWIEIGGTDDTISGAEDQRDELLKIGYGVWDLIKNHPDGRGHGWELEWIGMLPGKRENARYVGDHTFTQNDIEAEGRFDDMVAYGGWTMDDHPPEAFRYSGQPTTFHPAPSPYGIPYRALYSRNIQNLFFAGRNISATHMALSSTRVMATCALMGQAVGTAAAIAVQHGCSPREVYLQHIRQLQTALMDDDCYLPWHVRPAPKLSEQAVLIASMGDPEPLRNGVDRSLGTTDNGWWGAVGSWVAYHFELPTAVSALRFTFDSNLKDNKRMPCSYPLQGNHVRLPAILTRAFDIDVLDEQGEWQTVHQVHENHQRLVRVPLEAVTRGVRFVVRASWGAPLVHLFAFDVR
jgi:FAD dependent oxidoreductase